MKQLLLLLLFFLALSCKKEPEKSYPVSCFSWLPDNQIHVGDTVHFKNCSENAGQYLWLFGDQGQSTDFEPVHLFSAVGDFEVTLIAFGTDRKDTLTRKIGVKEQPGPTYIRVIQNKELATIGRGGIYTLDLDVEGDGTADYQFKLDSWSQLSGAGWSRGSITGIHGTYEVNGYSVMDTTFLSKKWSVQDGAYWGMKIAVIRTETESCRRISEADSILQIESINRISRFDNELTSGPGSLWTSGELCFWNSRGYGIGLWEEKRNADTVWFMTRGNKVTNCHNFPSDTSCIGIRYSKGNTYKTGWIKLILSKGKFTILESGIME